MHVGCLTWCCWYTVITQQMQALLLLLEIDGGCRSMRSPLLQILKSGYLVLRILEAPVRISISCYTVDICGPFESVESSLPPCSSYPLGFLFHSLDFYSWIICQRYGPRILTLNRFSSLNGPVLCCHPDTLPPLQPSATGRECL